MKLLHLIKNYIQKYVAYINSTNGTVPQGGSVQWQLNDGSTIYLTYTNGLQDAEWVIGLSDIPNNSSSSNTSSTTNSSNGQSDTSVSSSGNGD